MHALLLVLGLQNEESAIGESERGGGGLSDDVVLVIVLLLSALGLALLLRYERNPSRHNDRVNKAARRAASRWTPSKRDP